MKNHNLFIRLDSTINERLRAEAQERKWSITTLVEQALISYLDIPTTTKGQPKPKGV